MLAVNYTNLRDNMKMYMDKVTDIISEETYNNLMENIYVMGNKENYDWLMKGKAQLESGQCAIHELFEAEDNE